MDYNTIVSIINSIGFPAVMCGCMMWYIKYVTDKHDNEMSSITTAINNNTEALIKLMERLEK